MGRLSHLQQSLPRLLATGLGVTVVDYSCPEHAGDWASSEHTDALQSGQLCVTRITGRRRFRKVRAHNAGAQAALARGAQTLCFIDADTLVEPELGRWLRHEYQPSGFGVFGPAAGKRDLFGTLVMAAATFRLSLGYDESFWDWGMEDMEYRLRLRLFYGLSYQLIPARLAQPIAHGDALRTRFYGQRDPRISNHRNWKQVLRRVKSWTGRELAELPRSDLRPLLGLRD